MSWEILTLAFVQRAAIAGVLVGFMGSAFGSLVVQRKMSFMGDGLAHVAFGGVALGLLLGTEPLWIAVPFTLLVSFFITWLKERTKLETDTSIGIFFAVSVALGIIFISMKKDYSTDAFAYLFGSILSVTSSDLIITALLSLAVIVVFKIFWSRWAYSAFDRDLAESDRINVRRDEYIFSMLLSLVIVISIKLVGIVLISSFLVIPAATAKLISDTFYKMTRNAVIIGVISSISGLVLSIIFDMPSGAVIILSQALFFSIVVVWNQFKIRSN
jgi:zinc transport system permease protein